MMPAAGEPAQVTHRKSGAVVGVSSGVETGQLGRVNDLYRCRIIHPATIGLAMGGGQNGRMFRLGLTFRIVELAHQIDCTSQIVWIPRHLREQTSVFQRENGVLGRFEGRQSNVGDWHDGCSYKSKGSDRNGAGKSSFLDFLLSAAGELVPRWEEW
jgi:hypothetical protein